MPELHTVADSDVVVRAEMIMKNLVGNATNDVRRIGEIKKSYLRVQHYSWR